MYFQNWDRNIFAGVATKAFERYVLRETNCELENFFRFRKLVCIINFNREKHKSISGRRVRGGIFLSVLSHARNFFFTISRTIDIFFSKLDTNLRNKKIRSTLKHGNLIIVHRSKRFRTKTRDQLTTRRTKDRNYRY